MSANSRKESRDAHAAADFLDRDGGDWLRHTLWLKHVPSERSPRRSRHESATKSFERSRC
ncbi:hypothetical protein [Caballeronia sp. KNU42]